MIELNNTSFPVKISEELKHLYKKYKARDNKDGLFFYQWYLPYLFSDPRYGMGDGSRWRGVLIYHETGVGKTNTGANLAITLSKNRDVVLLMPKSLHSNFRRTMDRLKSRRGVSFDEYRMKWISMDAYNAGDQLCSLGTLDNKILVVDEAHNLFRSIISSHSDSTNARRIYDLIMAAKNIRIVFLSGTPIMKDPFEIVPCMNMLSGVNLLPTDYETFYKYFVENRKIKNRDKLQNRLFGYISHISYTMKTNPDDTADRNKPRDDNRFPEDLGTNVIKIEMSEAQYSKYVMVRDKEDRIKKTSKYKRDTPMLSLPGGDNISSYYVESRMISNYCPLIEDADFDNLSDSHFTRENSPKMAKLIEMLNNAKGLSIVSSQFVGIGGIGALSRYLMLAGYTQLYGAVNIKQVDTDAGGSESQDVTPPVSNDSLPPVPSPLPSSLPSPSPLPSPSTVVPKRRFAILSGDVKDEDREAIRKIFNSPQNRHGELLSVLLLSQVGVEGLNLLCVREVHILEPYWYWSRIEQTRARAIRLGSHNDLNYEDRDVTTYIYVSMPNKKVYEGLAKKEDYSIDEKFLLKAITKHKLINEFLVMMKEVSLECVVNEYKNCRVCIPNNNKLYTNIDDIKIDLEIVDPCIQTVNIEIEAKLITVNGIEYSYVDDPTATMKYRVFKYDKNANGHVELSQSSDEYINVIEAIRHQ